MHSQTFRQLRQLWSHLPPTRHWQFLKLIPISVLPGIIDLASVAVIARLTGSFVNSDLADNLPGIHVFGGDSVNQGIMMILVFILLAWLASTCKILLRLFQQRLSVSIWRDLSNKVYEKLLLQHYEYHLSRSTSDLSSQLLTNVSRVSSYIVLPILQIFSAAASIILLSIGILFVGKLPAVLLIISLVGAYALISSAVTPRLRICSIEKIRFESESMGILMGSLFSISDIHLTSSEPYFVSQYERQGDRARHYAWLSEWLPDLPRALIEPFGITMIFAVGALPALMNGDPTKVRSIMPFLATIAVAALRLTPPLQDCFRSLTHLRGGLPMLEKALELLELPVDRATRKTPGVPSPGGVFPRHTIRLNNVWYRYPQSDDWVIRGMTLTIPVGSRVAFVGSTGGGKTTTALLMLGLLQPTQGDLELDCIPVETLDLPAWQSSCAHVPQAINLLNGSIQENVAFGVPSRKIDSDRVWKALEAAQLHDFTAYLPYGLDTQIGENGVRLSGGQRQRLALARAFYRGAKFLVLDEATSALDNRTESDVIESLDVIGRTCTTLVIAHRLSTVKRCDRIFEFQDGVVKASGTYHELKERSDSFRDLIQLGERTAAL